MVSIAATRTAARARSRSARFLLIAAMVTCAIALVRPALTTGDGSPVASDAWGWRAAVGMIPFGLITMVDAVVDRHDARVALLGAYITLCGLTNVVFVYAGIVAARRALGRHLRRLRWMTAASVVVAALAPWILGSERDPLGSGWLLWLIAHSLLFACVWIAPDRPSSARPQSVPP